MSNILYLTWPVTSQVTQSSNFSTLSGTSRPGFSIAVLIFPPGLLVTEIDGEGAATPPPPPPAEGRGRTRPSRARKHLSANHVLRLCFRKPTKIGLIYYRYWFSCSTPGEVGYAVSNGACMFFLAKELWSRNRTNGFWIETSYRVSQKSQTNLFCSQWIGNRTQVNEMRTRGTKISLQFLSHQVLLVAITKSSSVDAKTKLRNFTFKQSRSFWHKKIRIFEWSRK